MATLTVGDIVQVVQTWDTPLSSVAQNVWHLEMVSGAGADSSLLLPAILTQQQVAFADITLAVDDHFEVVQHDLLLYDFAVHRFNGLHSQAASSMVGTGTGDYSPHGVAAVGRIVTEIPRRQGRTFIPGLADTAIFDGVLVAAIEVDLADYLADFIVDISVTGGLFTWCTFNQEPLSIYYETSSLTIGSVIANSLPGYQRRRKPGVGL